MPKPTPPYIRRQFMRQFSQETSEQRLGTIEALTVIHEYVAEKADTPKAEQRILEPEPDPLGLEDLSDAA